MSLVMSLVMQAVARWKERREKLASGVGGLKIPRIRDNAHRVPTPRKKIPFQTGYKQKPTYRVLSSFVA